MNLCIDIGNTLVKLAVYQKGGFLLYKAVSEGLTVQDLENISAKYPFSRSMVASSGNFDQGIRDWLDNEALTVQWERVTHLPFQIDYDTPETLGKDRIAASVGGKILFKNGPVCVITMGTCITYNIITGDGIFVGGNISPGLDMRLRAMHDYTENLPLVEKGGIRNWIGKSTAEALRNGAVLGTKFEVESFIEKIRQEFSEINIILTGGDAIFFADKINSQIFVNLDLVLLGLNAIIELNA